MNINLVLPFLDSLSFDRLLWLVPIFFMLHNMEEAPFMERWSKRLPLKIHLDMTTRQFSIAVTFLTLAGFLITFLEIKYLYRYTGYLLILGIQAILLFNAFIPHIASIIGFRMYSPGVVTALLLILPFSYYLFRRALAEDIITSTQFWILLGIAPFAMVIFAVISLLLGKALDK
ncbi:MAG TPA: HXXEE domain-containing protein [Anaerolineales bacterium]|nr:HXXEE domain-containing protein [Anaerolineales bacterium]